MEREKMSERNNTEWVESVEERLRWFLEEATEEEFDAEEVETLVTLLNKLKPLEAMENQKDEEALERFHEYVKLREAEERTRENASDNHAEGVYGIDKSFDSVEKPHNGMEEAHDGMNKPLGVMYKSLAERKRTEVTGREGKKRGGISFFFKTHKLVAAAAAILLVVLVAGGSMGVANANKGNGFFYWLKKDDEGTTMLISPEGMDEKLSFEESEKYYSLKEVPEEFQKYVISKEEIPQLKDVELESVTVNRAMTCYRIKQWFIDEAKKNIYIGVLIYKDDVRLTRDSHLSENVQFLDEGEIIEDGILVRENKIESDNNKIYFYKGNIKYFVEGDIEAEILIQIAKNYRDIVLEK